MYVASCCERKIPFHRKEKPGCSDVAILGPLNSGMLKKKNRNSPEESSACWNSKVSHLQPTGCMLDSGAAGLHHDALFCLTKHGRCSGRFQFPHPSMVSLGF